MGAPSLGRTATSPSAAVPHGRGVPSRTSLSERTTDAAGRDLAHRHGSRLVHVYAVLVMILGTGAFVSLVESDIQSVVFALWGCAYIFAVAGLADDVFRHRRKILLPPTLVLMVAWAVTSTLWSTAPDVTLRRSLGLAGTVLIGLYLARRLSPLELFDALRRAVLVVVLASLLLYASGSNLALDETHSTLRGVLPTKNSLGRVIALGVLASSAVAIMKPSHRRRAAATAAVMLGALALTDSTGGMVMTALVAGVAGTLVLAAHPRGRVAVGGLVAMVLAAGVALLPGTSTAEVTGAVGKDATLTGRTDIWNLALDAFWLRPVNGYGYGAFWHDDLAPPQAQLIRALLQWNVSGGHNGLLDIGLDLGLIGVVIALVALLSLVVRGVVDLRKGRRTVGGFRLSVAGGTIVMNLTESGLFQLNTLYTVLLAAALAVRPTAPDPEPRHT
jgi:exopolysaccharide production protein ExoQ